MPENRGDEKSENHENSKQNTDNMQCCPRWDQCGLEFLDQSGAPVAVELPLDQAEAVVMTLPHLLTRALVNYTGNEEARYVFDLEEWSSSARRTRIALSSR